MMNHHECFIGPRPRIKTQRHPIQEGDVDTSSVSVIPMEPKKIIKVNLAII